MVNKMDILKELLLNYEAGYSVADCVEYMDELLSLDVISYQDGKEVLSEFYDIIAEA
jgi:hypothetical protein